MGARCLRAAARGRAPVLERRSSAPGGGSRAPLGQIVPGRWRGFVADWPRAALRNRRESRGFLALGVPEHALDGRPLVSEDCDGAIHKHTVHISTQRASLAGKLPNESTGMRERGFG